jgi:hypothetical protein
MNVRNAESAMIAGKAVIADNARKVRRIETIPEGSDENSPALQCWVRIMPIRPSRRDDRNGQIWALSGFREIENDPSSLTARITVKNGDQAPGDHGVTVGHGAIGVPAAIL